MNTNPIYLIDDDTDDYEFLQMAVDDLKLQNKIRHFKDGESFLVFFKTSNEVPFIILCDVNVFPYNGFSIRERILQDQKTVYKSVPFIFWSNEVSEVQIQKAYDLAVHGFFTKGSSMEEMKQFIKNIFNYWLQSKVPSENVN